MPTIAPIRPVPRWLHVWAILTVIPSMFLLALGALVTTYRVWHGRSDLADGAVASVAHRLARAEPRLPDRALTSYRRLYRRHRNGNPGTRLMVHRSTRLGTLARRDRPHCTLGVLWTVSRRVNETDQRSGDRNSRYRSRDDGRQRLGSCCFAPWPASRPEPQEWDCVLSASSRWFAS